MHDLNLTSKIHFYTDASEFAAKLVITQFREGISEEVFIESVKSVMKTLSERSIRINKSVKVLVIYDFFSFSFT